MNGDASCVGMAGIAEVVLRQFDPDRNRVAADFCIFEDGFGVVCYLVKCTTDPIYQTMQLAQNNMPILPN